LGAGRLNSGSEFRFVEEADMFTSTAVSMTCKREVDENV